VRGRTAFLTTVGTIVFFPLLSAQAFLLPQLGVEQAARPDAAKAGQEAIVPSLSA
jgi:hypothetical protein